MELHRKKLLKSRQMLKNGTNIVLIRDLVQEANIRTVPTYNGKAQGQIQEFWKGITVKY